MEKHMARFRILTTIATLALVAILAMSGCLISSASGSKTSGAYVRPSSVSQVQLNQSTESDVEDIMGQPSATIEHDDGTETWTWNWTKTTASGGTVLFLFSGESKNVINESVHIKFANGVAVKKWRD